MFKRLIFQIVMSRLKEPRHFIQVLSGPRQVGKTTLIRQVLDELGAYSHYASADEPTLKDRVWLEQQWDLARIRLKEKNLTEFVLVLDEIQKIPEWSSKVKQLWDEDTAQKLPLKVVLLGSAPLLIQRGLTESLAGRFELLPITHWTYSEMKSAFGWDLNQYIYFGGYPGATSLIHDEERWKRYIADSLIETTISRDILLLTRVDKPALLRHLFQLACEYSGQILSYQKMLGQLHDAGNTTTLAHYLDLLSGAGMVTGLQKYFVKTVHVRGSSPKLQVLNTALMTATNHHTFSNAQVDGNFWGRLVESAVGAYLVNSTLGTSIKVFYWRENNKEVDFILKNGKDICAFEIKSGRRRDALPGLEAFVKIFNPKYKFLVGGQGIPLEEFFLMPIEKWFI